VQHFGDRPHLMLQWHDPVTGQRRSKSAGTCNPLDAERIRADLEYEINNGLHQQAARMSWERFRELFEAEYFPGLREETRLVYGRTFTLFERLTSPGSLSGITERTVSAFAAKLYKQRGRGPTGLMAPLTVKIHLQFLRSALSWAARQKLIPEVPEFPAVKVPKRRPQPVAAEAFERLLAKADGQTRAFLLCGWLAGLRRNEALELRRSETDRAPWVDFSRKRVWLPAGFVKAVEDQWVPLDPLLEQALLALPDRGPRVFFFLSETTGRPLSPSAVSQRISKLAREAGVLLSMKILRRGFGCRYAGKVPAQVLQRLMRHSNIAVTMDYYANVDQAVDEAVLGPQRNGSRNNDAPGAPAQGQVQRQVTTGDGASRATG
jgi:integrase